MATEGGYETHKHKGNNGKKYEPRLAQTVAACAQLWLGLGLIAVFFLGWLVGTAIGALGLGINLILIDVVTNRRRGHDGQ